MVCSARGWHNKKEAGSFLRKVNNGYTGRGVHGISSGSTEIIVYDPKTGETRNALNEEHFRQVEKRF